MGERDDMDMTVDTAAEALTFDQLRAALGESQHRVRAALIALQFRPEAPPDDRRSRRYRSAWIAPLRAWLTEHPGMD